MSISSVLDTVESGISEAEQFMAKIGAAAEGFFGAGSPQAAGLAQALAGLQKAASEVSIVVGGVPQALVLTETVYNQVVGGLDKLAGIAAGETAQQKLASVIEMALTDGLPLVLSVVAPGASPVLTLAEDILMPLVAPLIAKYL